jgi:hypothetical protein
MRRWNMSGDTMKTENDGAGERKPYSPTCPMGHTLDVTSFTQYAIGVYECHWCGHKFFNRGKDGKPEWAEEVPIGLRVAERGEVGSVGQGERVKPGPPYSAIDKLLTDRFGWPWQQSIQTLYAGICDLFDKPHEAQPEAGAVTEWELIRKAAQEMDWGQVVGNGGPPCFFFEQERGRFCGRAERWVGHDGDPHKFVSLAVLLASVAPSVEEREEKILSLVKASVHLAILRHDLGNDDIDIDGIMEDTANAVRGIDTCAEEPIPEWKALRAALERKQSQ